MTPTRKKVLILCNDFPPLNSAGAQRPYSWYRHFPQHRLFPVVITKKWEENITSVEKKFSVSDPKKEVIALNESLLIKVVPSLNRRNALIAGYGMQKKVLKRRWLSLRMQFLSPFFFSEDEHSYLYETADEYLGNNQVDFIISTAEPFILFKYAHLLSLKYRIPWIADYRDPWRNNHSLGQDGFFKRLFHKYYNLFEKPWTASCIKFTTTSLPFLNNIAGTINKEGVLIRNGFDETVLPGLQETSDDAFVLLYVGTVYDSACVSIFLEGLKDFLTKVKAGPNSFKLIFVGTELNKTKGTERILSFIRLHSDFITLIPARSNQAVLQLIAGSTVLLNMVPGSLNDGIYPVKLYEYLALKKPVISIEAKEKKDENEFSPFLHNCFNKEQFRENLTTVYAAWKKGELHPNSISDEMLNTFKRSYQSKLLAEEIHRLLA